MPTVRFCYDLLFCWPSCRRRPDLRPATEDIYIRASDGLVAHAVAGHHNSAKWVISALAGFSPVRSSTSFTALSWRTDISITLSEGFCAVLKF